MNEKKQRKIPEKRDRLFTLYLVSLPGNESLFSPFVSKPRFHYCFQKLPFRFRVSRARVRKQFLGNVKSFPIDSVCFPS
jgi:hypothetical protein